MSATLGKPANVCRRAVAGALAPLLLALAALPALGQSLPANWRESAQRSSEVERVFEAAGLPAGEFAMVRQSPRGALGGQSLQQWTADRVAKDTAPTGSWAAAAQVVPKSSELVTATRQFHAGSPQAGLAIYFSVSRDGRQARLFRVAFSSEQVGRGSQGTAAQNLVSGLVRAELGGTLRESISNPGATTAAAPAAPKANVERKFATAPGAGLRAEQIETVYYHWDQRYDAFQGLVIDEDVYLLLKDGTAYNGFDLPPQDFDVAASRRAEPKKWGRWRRDGGSYALSWPDSPTYRVPRGNAVSPSRPGLRLQQQFTGSSSYTLPGGGTSTWSEFTMTLGSDGRFERSSFGGASVSSGSTRTMTAYDDNGAVSSSSTSSAAISGSSRRADQGDRRGRYEIDGYSIVLRYDNGVVERRPFFLDEGGAGAWLMNTRMMRKR